MEEDKRIGDKPVPDDIENYLNDLQQSALKKIEEFGWGMKFIRRPLFMETLIVVTNTDGSSIGVLEDDGRLSIDPGIDTRENSAGNK